MPGVRAPPVVLAVAIVAVSAPANAETALEARAERLHRGSLVVDAHNDVTTLILDYGFDLGMRGDERGRRDATLYWIRSLHWLLPEVTGADLRTDTDIHRLRAGGVDAQFFSIFVDSHFVPAGPEEAGRATARAHAMIDALLEQVERHPDHLDHIDHVARVAGVDHVGLGSDFASSFNMPAGMKEVTDFPNVTRALLERGYDAEAVRKILGGNILRVLARAEALAEDAALPAAAHDDQGVERRVQRQ